MMKTMFAAAVVLATGFATPALAGGPQITVNGSVGVSSIGTKASGSGTIGSLTNSVQMNQNAATNVSLPKGFSGKLTENGSGLGSNITTIVKGKSSIGTIKDMVTMGQWSPTTLKLR